MALIHARSPCSGLLAFLGISVLTVGALYGFLTRSELKPKSFYLSGGPKKDLSSTQLSIFMECIKMHLS